MIRRLFLATLVCAVLFSISCVGDDSNTDNSANKVISSVLSVEAGNTFVAYRAERSIGDHDIHLQKIDSKGAVHWDNALFTGDDRRANVIGMVNNENNGVFIAWEVLAPEDGKEGPHHFDRNIIMNVDAQGQIQRRQDLFEKGMQMVNDGMGGVIIAWATEDDFRVLRENGPGSTLWAQTITSSGTGLKLAAGENGESFILWNNRDNPYFVAQKLGADGQVLWGQEGMPEGVRIKHLDTALPPEPQIISDGSGGAIVSWAEVTGGGMPSYVWVCWVGDEGQVLNAEPVRELTSTVNTQIRVATDRQLGVIVVWEDHRNGMALYAKRNNPLSSFLPPENGVPVCSGLPEVSPRFEAIGDGKGGVVVAWIDGDHKLYAQLLDPFGEKQWGDNGILIADNLCDLPVKLSGDPENGFILGWCEGTEIHHPGKSYVQKIDAEGKLLWGEDGIKLKP